MITQILRNHLGHEFESWHEILTDVDRFLSTKTVIDQMDSHLLHQAQLLDASFPALCRRVCELCSRLGPTFGEASGDVLICHENDVVAGVLRLRVFESFPGYALDRTAYTIRDQWTLHTRSVRYRADSLAHSEDIVARALLAGKDMFGRPEPGSNTPSEEDVVALWSLIPSGVGSTRELSLIEPGEVVSLSIVFYSEEAIGVNSLFETIERKDKLKSLLDDLNRISRIVRKSREDLNRYFQASTVAVEGEALKLSLSEFAMRILSGMSPANRK